MRTTLAAIVATLVVSGLAAQSNTVAGLDGRLEILDDITYWARRGAAHPGGEVGLSMRNTMCNPGSVFLPWFAVPLPNHPKFGFLITRVSDGRMVQISDRSFCKHAFTSASTNGACGTCDGVGGNQMGLRCSDTYNAGHNASQWDLGPADEMDPWLGTWSMVGSYFDRGDPSVGGAAATDGFYSLDANGFDGVKNRVTVKEADLLVVGASYFYGIHLMHQGEAVANRGDNLASRGFVPNWNGSTWSVVNNGIGQVWGSILQHWTGATLNNGGNGNDDGRFFVASKVTPIGGGFHYEYAIHNVDNHRGGAALRIPVAAGATVTNFGFRDIDGNALNQWTAARVGNEIVFSAAANNALNWNTIYNFWFDCTQAPSQGLLSIDEARPGPGALTVTVFGDVPSGVPTAFNTSVGTGCTGAPGPCFATVHETFAAASFDLANNQMGLQLSGGNYTLGAASGTYVTPVGSNLGLGDDVEQQITLPFTLPYPGGTTTRLWVCSNGFVSAAINGAPYDANDAVFRGMNACWAAAWHDLNPSAGGQVLHSSSPTAVRISFVGVPTFGGGGSHTFQFEFLPSGQVNVYWRTMTTTGSAYLAGWTAGNDTGNPGNADLSAMIAAGNTSLCPTSTIVLPLTLAAGSRPVLGTTVNMTTTNIPAGSGVAGLIYSFTQAAPPIDLTAFGMAGCFAHVGAFEIYGLNLLPATTMVDAVMVPGNPQLVGLTATMQAISYSPPRTTLGWLSSNGIVMFLAAQ